MSDCYPGTGGACNEKPTYGYRHTNEPIHGPVPFSFEAIEDTRYLVVSNSPEEIAPFGIPQTLYKVDFNDLASTAKFRVWIWHVNTSAVDVANVGLQ